MGNFENALRTHDWYFCYSDDHRVWMAGQRIQATLKEQHKKLNCPHGMDKLRQYVHEQIVDLFLEEEPGNWYRQPRTHKNMAPISCDELLSREESEEIKGWFAKNDPDVSP